MYYRPARASTSAGCKVQWALFVWPEPMLVSYGWFCDVLLVGGGEVFLPHRGLFPASPTKQCGYHGSYYAVYYASTSM